MHKNEIRYFMRIGTQVYSIYVCSFMNTYNSKYTYIRMLFQILYYDMASNWDLITVITEESDKHWNQKEQIF